MAFPEPHNEVTRDMDLTWDSGLLRLQVGYLGFLGSLLIGEFKT